MSSPSIGSKHACFYKQIKKKDYFNKKIIFRKSYANHGFPIPLYLLNTQFARVKVSATISELVVFHWRVRSPTYPTITKSFYKYTRALQAKLARFKLNSQLALLS